MEKRPTLLSLGLSDATGVIAFGSTAIGWQVAAADFSDVQAFVVCIEQ